MSDNKPSTSSNDAEAVIAALKDLGASNYAALAKATGLSKIAVSAAITELRKSGLVNSESGGKYSAAESNKTTPAAKESTGSKVAETEEPPPPPPPPPPESSDTKPTPSAETAATSGDDDTVTVLGALRDLGASNYAALAKATGLSKIAVSTAITELRKGGLVNSESGGKYSAANGNTATPAAKESTGSKAAKPKASPASSEKPKPAASSGGSDADVVLAALKGLGNANYAVLAQTTGLSKIAVSSAITDLSKRGLVNSQPGGKYSPAGHTPKQTKAAPATVSEATPPTGSLADELEKLATLRESGALTAAEYTKAKKKLLDTN
jgi:DNA-binding IscR family transcriptional regulator